MHEHNLSCEGKIKNRVTQTFTFASQIVPRTIKIMTRIQNFTKVCNVYQIRIRSQRAYSLLMPKKERSTTQYFEIHFPYAETTWTQNVNLQGPCQKRSLLASGYYKFFTIKLFPFPIYYNFHDHLGRTGFLFCNQELKSKVTKAIVPH